MGSAVLAVHTWSRARKNVSEWQHSGFVFFARTDEALGLGFRVQWGRICHEILAQGLGFRV